MGATSAYKKYFDPKAVGDAIACTIRIEFGFGWVKAYVKGGDTKEGKGDLFIVCGNIDYSGETLYGNAYPNSTNATFLSHIENPADEQGRGLGIGIQMWETLTPLGGEIKFTDIKYGALPAAATETQTQSEYELLTYIDDKERR